jgi:DNA-binding response OmpR family regulator
MAKEDKKSLIMLVEDDTNLNFVTRDNLEQYGFKVLSFENGVEALDAFEKHNFDLCLLDVMMPKLDGFSLAKVIRAKNENIPILFLTAKSLPEDKIEGLKLGADDYILKPFNIEELILRIEVFLKRSRNGHLPVENAIKLGAYQFNFKELTLTHGKEVQKLTIKEAELLRLFAGNINRILKREEILKALWGDDDYFLGRSLDVFISRLRKYLRHDPAIKLENIHRVGFRMEVG